MTHPITHLAQIVVAGGKVMTLPKIPEVEINRMPENNTMKSNFPEACVTVRKY